jgi:hypothetical protein
MIMTIADLDRDLERYRSAADVVSANLLELDRDPNRQLLETAPLVGLTADEWQGARTALASVWDWSARFTAFLDQAAELRVSPRTRLAPARELLLERFLTEASIELASDEIPLRDRDLLQQRRVTSQCTADELLALMSGAFARAREMVSRVGAAWNELIPRLASARADLAAVGAIDTGRVQEELDALTEALVTDPLSVTEVAVHDAEASVAMLTRSAAAALALRDEWQERLRSARAELERLERDLAAARAAHAVAATKILDPALPEPPGVDPHLAAGLDAVVGLADAGRWDEAAVGLEQWHGRSRRSADAAVVALEASRAPMVERDHLRGRLDACRAKAHGLDLDEDAVVTEAYERARAALFVAPTDLRMARHLVDRYQQLLITDHEPEARR